MIPWRRKWQTHSSILAWSIPWAEEPGRVQSTRSQRVRHGWAHTHMHAHTSTCTHTQTHTDNHSLKKPVLCCGATQWRDTHGQGTNVSGQRSVRVWDLPRATQMGLETDTYLVKPRNDLSSDHQLACSYVRPWSKDILAMVRILTHRSLG